MIIGYVRTNEIQAPKGLMRFYKQWFKTSGGKYLHSYVFSDEAIESAEADSATFLAHTEDATSFDLIDTTELYNDAILDNALPTGFCRDGYDSYSAHDRMAEETPFKEDLAQVTRNAIANHMLVSQQFANKLNGGVGQSEQMNQCRNKYGEQYFEHGNVQPIYIDASGAPRFKPNKLIQDMYAAFSPTGELALDKYGANDIQQLHQLLGMDVGEWSEGDYSSNYLRVMADGGVQYALRTEFSQDDEPYFLKEEGLLSSTAAKRKGNFEIDNAFINAFIKLKKRDVSLIAMTDGSKRWEWTNAGAREKMPVEVSLKISGGWELHKDVIYYNGEPLFYIAFNAIDDAVAEQNRARAFTLDYLLSEGDACTTEIVSLVNRCCQAAALIYKIKYAANNRKVGRCDNYAEFVNAANTLADGMTSVALYRDEVGSYSDRAVVMASTMPRTVQIILQRASALTEKLGAVGDDSDRWTCHYPAVLAIGGDEGGEFMHCGLSKYATVAVKIPELTKSLIACGFIIEEKEE